MKINNKHMTKKGFSLVELLVVITIIVTLIGISIPTYSVIRKKLALTKSSAHARGLLLGCQLFADDYQGVFMNEATAARFGNGASVDSSADSFQFLIDTGNLGDVDEEFFFTKELNNSTINDHVLGNEDGDLLPTECGYTYVVNLSDTSPAKAPVITTRLVNPGTSTFGTEVWGHKALIGRVDGSVEAAILSGTNGEDGPVQETIDGVENQDVFIWATGAGGFIAELAAE